MAADFARIFLCAWLDVGEAVDCEDDGLRKHQLKDLGSSWGAGGDLQLAAQQLARSLAAARSPRRPTLRVVGNGMVGNDGMKIMHLKLKYGRHLGGKERDFRSVVALRD